MEKIPLKKIALLVIGGILLNWSLYHMESILAGMNFIWGILLPFVLGLIIAFLLNIPMKSIETKVFGAKGGKMRRPISVVITLVLVVSVVSLVVFLVIPQLVQTVAMLAYAMPQYIEDTQSYLNQYSEYIPMAQSFAKDLNLDWNAMIGGFVGVMQTGVSSIFLSAAGMATSVISGVVAFSLGIIFAIYVLIDKEKLLAQTQSVLKAHLSEKNYQQLHSLVSLVSKTFAQFVSGQCRESLAVGALFTLALLIGRFNYALLIGVLIGFMSLIPIIGSFIGCVVGVFLILVSQGIWRALAFLILFLILQQLDGNFMYPYIVGNKVGLPPLWVMLAVMVGGSLAGIIGMLTFIPIFSVFYTLLAERTKKRLLERNIPSPIDEYEKTAVHQNAKPPQKKK